MLEVIPLTRQRIESLNDFFRAAMPKPEVCLLPERKSSHEAIPIFSGRLQLLIPFNALTLQRLYTRCRQVLYFRIEPFLIFREYLPLGGQLPLFRADRSLFHHKQTPLLLVFLVTLTQFGFKPLSVSTESLFLFAPSLVKVIAQLIFYPATDGLPRLPFGDHFLSEVIKLLAKGRTLVVESS